MKDLWKYSGWYLLIVGIIHNVVCWFFVKDIVIIMLHDGLLNTVASQIDRNAAFWCLFAGVFLMFIGLVWQQQINQFQKPLPKIAAWGLTLITIISLLIMPLSGFWIVLPLCIIMLYPHYVGG